MAKCVDKLLSTLPTAFASPNLVAFSFELRMFRGRRSSSGGSSLRYGPTLQPGSEQKIKSSLKGGIRFIPAFDSGSTFFIHNKHLNWKNLLMKWSYTQWKFTLKNVLLKVIAQLQLHDFLMYFWFYNTSSLILWLWSCHTTLATYAPTVR